MVVDDSSPFDLDELLDRCLGDNGFATEMLTLFGEQAVILVERLTIALRNGDTLGASKAAHSLKGSAGNIGAKLLVSQLLRLESALRAGEMDLAQSMLDDTLANANACITAVPCTIRMLRSAA